MDIRRPGASQALPRKRFGDWRGQEEGDKEEEMHGGSARRRRAWWRGDDDDMDDWYGEATLGGLLPRRIETAGPMDDGNHLFGANLPSPQRTMTQRPRDYRSQQQQPQPQPSPELWLPLQIHEEVPLQAPLLPLPRLPPHPHPLPLYEPHEPQPQQRPRANESQQQQRSQAQPPPELGPPSQFQEEAALQAPPLPMLRSPPQPLLQPLLLHEPQLQQLPAYVLQLQRPPQLTRPETGPARGGPARRLAAWPPARRLASDSAGAGRGVDADADVGLDGGALGHGKYWASRSAATYTGASVISAGRRNAGADFDCSATTVGTYEDAQMALAMQEDLEERQRADERRRRVAAAAAAAAQAAAGGVVGLADAVPTDSVNAVVESCDLLKGILKGLGVVDLCRVARVSRLWRAVVDDPSFWRSVCVMGRRVTSEQILRLCRRQRGVIEELRLSGHSQLPGDPPFMQRLLINLSGLRVLELRSAYLTERAFAQLSTAVPSLRELVLGEVQVLGTAGGAADASLNHPGLTYLELNQFKAGRLSLSCPHVARLCVASTQLAALIASATTLPAIQHLHLASTSRISDQSLFSALNSLTSLLSLTLVESAVSEEQLRGIARCLTNLTHLELLDCSGVGLSPGRGTVQFPALRRLSVLNCDSLTSTAAAPLLEGCGSLEELVLDGCGGLASLSLGLPVLRSVSVRGCRLLASLELRCRRLEEVSLGSMEPGGPGGAVLKRVLVASDSLRSLSWRHLPSLEDLTLDCPALTYLSLTDCDSLDDGIFSLLTDVQEVTLAQPTPPALALAPALAPALGPPRATSCRAGAPAQLTHQRGGPEAPAQAAALGSAGPGAAGAHTAPVADGTGAASAAPEAAPGVGAESGPAATSGLAAAPNNAAALGYVEAVVAAGVRGATGGVRQLEAGKAGSEQRGGFGAAGAGGSGGAGGPSVSRARAWVRLGCRALRGGMSDSAASGSRATEAALSATESRSVVPGPQAVCHTAMVRLPSQAALGPAPLPQLQPQPEPQMQSPPVLPRSGGDADIDIGDSDGSQFLAEEVFGVEPPAQVPQPQSRPQMWPLPAPLMLLQEPQLQRRSQPAAAMERQQHGQGVAAAAQAAARPDNAGPAAGSAPASGGPAAAPGMPIGAAARSSRRRRRFHDALSGGLRAGAWWVPEGDIIGGDDDDEDDIDGVRPPMDYLYDMGTAGGEGLPTAEFDEYDEVYDDVGAEVHMRQRRGAAVTPRPGAGAPPHRTATSRDLPPGRLAVQTASWPVAAPFQPSQGRREGQERELFAGPEVPPLQPQLAAPSLAPQPPLQPAAAVAPQPQPQSPTQQQQQQLSQVVAHPKVGGCPRLQELRLEGCEGLRHAQLRHARLERLSLRGCRGLLSLQLRCPALCGLVLEECGELGAVALMTAGLESLSLGACCALREAELVCPYLEQLSLKGCGGLRRVSLECPRLRDLDATFCGELTDEALVAALAHRPPLTSLVLSVCASLGVAVPAAVGAISELRHLDLSYSSVSQLGPLLTGCTALTSLCLGSCPELQGADLLALLPDRGHALPHLVSLDVSYCPLPYDIVGPLLCGLTYLTHFALNGCPGVDERLWRNSMVLHLPLPSSAAPALQGGQPQGAHSAPAQSPTQVAVSRLSKLSLVRCSALRSLCIGLLPHEEPATEAKESDNGGTGGCGAGGGAVRHCKATAAAGSLSAATVVSPAGGLSACPWQWPGAAAPLLGPPWRSTSCVLSGLASLRLGLSGVQTVALALPHLTHLDLNGCNALRCLELRCPLLAELHLQACCALPADLLVPLLVGLGGAGSGRGLALLDAQHSGPFGEAVAAAVSAAAVMAAAAKAEEAGGASGAGGSSGAGAGGGVGGSGGAGGGRSAGVEGPMVAAEGLTSGLIIDGAIVGYGDSGGYASGSSTGSGGGSSGAGGGAGSTEYPSPSPPTSAQPSAADLLAARDTAWWLLPRDGTVLTCGPDCSVCGRRYRRAVLGLSG